MSLKLNDEQIESTVEEDLITTNDYVIKVISNGNIENKDDMEEVKEELVDRFSDVPRSVQTLLYIAYIKSMCKKLKIERVTQNQNEISLVPLTRYKTKEKVGYKIVNELVDLLEKMCKLNEK